MTQRDDSVSLSRADMFARMSDEDPFHPYRWLVTVRFLDATNDEQAISEPSEMKCIVYATSAYRAIAEVMASHIEGGWGEGYGYPAMVMAEPTLWAEPTGPG